MRWYRFSSSRRLCCLSRSITTRVPLRSSGAVVHCTFTQVPVPCTAHPPLLAMLPNDRRPLLLLHFGRIDSKLLPSSFKSSRYKRFLPPSTVLAALLNLFLNVNLGYWHPSTRPVVDDFVSGLGRGPRITWMRTRPAISARSPASAGDIGSSEIN